MNFFNREKIKVITLIHDIDSLRFYSSFGEKKEKRELATLEQSSHVICHNDKMKDYLISKGVPKNKISNSRLIPYYNWNTCSHI